MNRDVGKPGLIRLLREQETAGSNPAIPTARHNDSGGARAGTGTRLLTGGTQVRFLPPELYTRKGKPKGDGTRFELGRAMSLEGSTPSPSACGTRDWSSGTTPGLQPGDRGSTPRSRTRCES